MKKNFDPLDLENQNLLEDDSEQSMEEIMASIRKIMTPTSSQEENVLQSKENSSVSFSLTSSQDLPPQSISTSTEFSPEKNPPQDEVLVLTKKSPLLEKLRNASQNPKLNPTPSSQRIERKSSLEQLVSSALSPLIQTWLEKNLPNVVEKIVKEEIKTLLNTKVSQD